MPAPPPESEPAIVNARGMLVSFCDVFPPVLIMMAIPPGARLFPRRATRSEYLKGKLHSAALPLQVLEQARILLSVLELMCLQHHCRVRHRLLADLVREARE